MPTADPTDVPEAAANLIALLADEGVSHFFINPGTDSAPLQEALAAARATGNPTPQAVLCLHESVALAAAIGHHMISGSKSNLTSRPSCGHTGNGIWKCLGAASCPSSCVALSRSRSPARLAPPTSCCREKP
ncbi:thiamine pyrophosphate-binding protein [Candidatus Mycobacterium methanotrophicum]|uniref:thiamine pyrophosphate-binding protein n=1 Tax=Candidatus Mycobacterium methanotrophicum TaxID=2943498 RepID=UPI002111DF5C|nr:thiamine pyrophosphate-binding protein [Candidatus Mycobacterium methanotrophicum]